MRKIINWLFLASLLVLIILVGILFWSKSNARATAGWGDSNGGRPSYTLNEIDQGALGDKIVFNSISDSVIGDEKNFVAARENTGVNASTANVWHGNEIMVEDGKEYFVRLYVHNNNPNGENALAENVRVAFDIPTETSKDIPVNGFIYSDNADPSEYWDGVVFHAEQDFHLEYVYGSAIIENNGYAAESNGGSKSLGDEIVTKAASEHGVLIGYNELDGKIPGCYEYASYVAIRVKVVYDADYTIECKARLEGEKEWAYNVDANIGDKVEFQIQYANNSEKTHKNVMIGTILPDNLSYLSGSTILYNAHHRDGAVVESDAVPDTGINIGDYMQGTNAFVRFTAVVTDKNLKPGINTLVNWADGTVDDTILRDYVTIAVDKK